MGPPFPNFRGDGSNAGGRFYLEQKVGCAQMEVYLVLVSDEALVHTVLSRYAGRLRPAPGTPPTSVSPLDRRYSTSR